MDQLYGDIWGTAYTDALRDMTMDIISKDSAKSNSVGGSLGNTGISDSFGPGFYGMDTGELAKLPLLVDFDGLGIRISEGGGLLPVKSCGGLVFRVNGRYRPLDSACRFCSGKDKECRFCRATD